MRFALHSTFLRLHSAALCFGGAHGDDLRSGALCFCVLHYGGVALASR